MLSFYNLPAGRIILRGRGILLTGIVQKDVLIEDYTFSIVKIL